MIVEKDIKLKKTLEKERKLKKKQNQEQYKKDLVSQVYHKMASNVETIDDKEFALSKHYGTAALSQAGSMY